MSTGRDGERPRRDLEVVVARGRGPAAIPVVEGDVPVGQRRSRAAALLGLTEALVDAALAYYAEYTDEVDADLADRARVADETEALWRRQQALLER